MRTFNRLYLLLILALACTFIEPGWVAAQGWWGHGYNWPYNYPASKADFEQYVWDMEAYYFMNYYDPAYYRYAVPAYSQPIYGTPAYYIPKYTAVPMYTVAPTHTVTPTYTAPMYMAGYSKPSNNTFQYNQRAGNGSATYWLNEANVSYLAGSYEQAAESYAEAINLDPSLTAAWLNMGNSLYFLGKYQASLNAYNNLLNLEPQNADALAGRSLVLLALNKTDDLNTSTMI